MQSIHYISINEDFLARVVEREADKAGIFVLPGKPACRAALQIFQQQPGYRPLPFITVDDFLGMFYPAQAPRPDPLTRLAAFWQSLTVEDRDFWGFRTPAQARFGARDFLALFARFNQAMVTPEQADEAALEQGEGPHWQNWQRWLELYRRFTALLQKWGLQDDITRFSPQHFAPPLLERVVIAGVLPSGPQLEQALRSCPEVAIYRHGPASAFDERGYFTGNWASLGAAVKWECQFFNGPAQEQTALGLALQQGEHDRVVWQRQPDWAGPINPDLLNNNTDRRFSASGICTFYRVWQQLLSRSINTLGHWQFPLAYIISALRQRVFGKALCGSSRFLVIDTLGRLWQSDFRYLSLNPDCLRQLPAWFFPQGTELLQKLGELAYKTQRINSGADLVNFLDRFSGYPPRHLAAEDPTPADSMDAFYQVLEQIGFLSSCPDTLDLTDLSWLDFFVNIGGAATLPAVSGSTGYRALLLEDSDALNLNNPVFCHLGEKALTPAESPVYPLSAATLAKLGIREEEENRANLRYRFFRLLGSSPRATLLLSYPDDDTCASLIEELRLDGGLVIPAVKSDLPALILPGATRSVSQPGEDFFRFLPVYTPPTRFSFYSWNALLTNPFTWYLDHVFDREPLPECDEQDEMSHKYLGNLAHLYFAAFWQSHPHITSDFVISPLPVDLLDKMLFEGSQLWKRPGLAEQEFFRLVYLSRLEQAAGVLAEWLARQGNGEWILQNESTGKTARQRWLTPGGGTPPLLLSSRPDLLAVCNNEGIVIDYKTGGLVMTKDHRQQLAFYIYTLSDCPNYTVVNSGILLVQMAEVKPYYESLLKIEGELCEQGQLIHQMLAEGPAFRQVATPNEDQRITRRDLYKGGR